MLDELRDKQKEGYLLVVERKVTRFQCPDPLPAPPPAPTVLTNIVPPPPQHPPPPHPPPPPSAIQSAPVPVESFPQAAILNDDSMNDELPGRWRNHGRNAKGREDRQVFTGEFPSNSVRANDTITVAIARLAYMDKAYTLFNSGNERQYDGHSTTVRETSQCDQ